MGLLDWFKKNAKEDKPKQPKYEVKDGVEYVEGVPIKRYRSKGVTTLDVCVIILTFLALLQFINMLGGR